MFQGGAKFPTGGKWMRNARPQAREPRKRLIRCESGADGIVRMRETRSPIMNNSIDTKRIVLAALFTAASFALSFIQIPIFPAAPWLMYDPSGIVCLLAALAFGPKLGAAVAILSWLPRVFLDPFGAPMGMLSTCCLIIPTAIIYAKSGNTRAGSIAGMVAGAVLSIIAACALNLVVTPLYTAVTMEQVAGMILPILLPFNTLKMVINVVAGQVLLAPCTNVLRSQQGINSTRA